MKNHVFFPTVFKVGRPFNFLSEIVVLFQKKMVLCTQIFLG